MCLWWERETRQGTTFPPGVSVHLNENDPTSLMRAMGNMRAKRRSQRELKFVGKVVAASLQSRTTFSIKYTTTHYRLVSEGVGIRFCLNERL